MKLLGAGGRVRRGLRRLHRRARHLLDPPGLILLYHRIAAPGVDPWGISVRPDYFAQQLAVLSTLARPVALDQLQHAGRQTRPVQTRPVALTFDDGYADNLHVALPLLEQAQVPATVFVASGYLGQQQPFWWDELGGLLLGPHPLPRQLQLDLGGRAQTWTLAADPPIRPWRAETSPASGPRERLFLELYGLLRALGPAHREAALAALRGWAGSPGTASDPYDRPLTHPELAQLAAHPLIEIGAHTVSHPALSDLSPAAQQRELADSRSCLEQLTGRPVTSFSFPYGSRGPQSVGLVAKAGFSRACISGGQAVRRQTDPLALPRFTVGDWTGEEFAARLAGWLDG